MGTISIGNLPDKKSGIKFESFSQSQSEETLIQRVFCGLIHGGGDGGNVTISATMSISPGTSNLKGGGNSILSCTRFYLDESLS